MYPFLLSLFLQSSPAFARTAVVPHLHGQGVDENLLLNISRLLADEVRFHDQYSEVILLDSEESEITPECLRSTRCVYKHAKKKGSRVAVAGKVFVTGEKLEFYLVLCDKGYFKRNLRFQLDNDIMAIAEGLSPYIKELILGKSKKKSTPPPQEKLEEVMPVTQEPIILNADEQVDITIDDSETENLMGGDGLGWGSEDVLAKPVSKEERNKEAKEKLATATKREQERLEKERREREERERLERERREKEERERLERERREQERLEKERREREERERLERERREKEERERLKRERREQERLERERRRKQSSQSEEEKAAALLSAMRQEKAQKEEEKAAELLRAMRKEKEETFDLDPVEKPPETITSDFDFDTPTKPKKKKKVKKPKKKKPKKKNSSSSYEDIKARVTARIGVSKFQTLPAFITYGGEISYFPIPNFDIVVGAEAFATRRLISSDMLEEGESPQQWNTILPVNIGGLYHMDMEAILPYIGADIVMLPGYVRESSSMAMGLRLRTGIDFPVADTLHFNINISAGFLSGADFQLVQADLQSFGALPQFSAGTSFLF